MMEKRKFVGTPTREAWSSPNGWLYREYLYHIATDEEWENVMCDPDTELVACTDTYETPFKRIELVGKA